MSHFIEGLDRQRTMLLSEHLDGHIDEHSPVRAIDAFADMLDLAILGFNAHDATMLGFDRDALSMMAAAAHDVMTTDQCACAWRGLRRDAG